MDKREHKLDEKKADEILQKVLQAGNKAPASVPVYQLEKKRRMAKLPFIHGITLSAIALVLTLLAPLFFSEPMLPISVTTPAYQSGLFLEGNYAKDGVLTLKLSTNDIDLEHSYMESNTGVTSQPLSFNEQTKELRFPFPESESNIYVVSRKGGVLQILLTPDQ